ncbi:hypothetical protein DL96DRAFT_1705388 [Flagelloscypha sp. PMI_526]|nr:hypothetical protein DL96DRAFT_1705388 [Flagelloscypha sp. PMI_526]
MLRNLLRRLRRKKKEKSSRTRPQGTNSRSEIPPPLGHKWNQATVKEVLNLVEESRSLTTTEVAMDKIWSHDTWIEHSRDSSRLRAALPQLLVLRLQLPKPTEVRGIEESFARQTVFEYLLGCLRRLEDVRNRVPPRDSKALSFLSFVETTIFHRIAESLKSPNLYPQPHPSKIGGTQPGPTEIVNMLLDLSDGINVIRPWAPSSRYSKDMIRDFIQRLLYYSKRSPDSSLRVRDVFLPVILLLQRHAVQCQTSACWAHDHVYLALVELAQHAEIARITPKPSYEFVKNELPVCKLVGRHTVAPTVATEAESYNIPAESMYSDYSFTNKPPKRTLDGPAVSTTKPTGSTSMPASPPATSANSAVPAPTRFDLYRQNHPPSRGWTRSRHNDDPFRDMPLSWTLDSARSLQFSFSRW